MIFATLIIELTNRKCQENLMQKAKIMRLIKKRLRKVKLIPFVDFKMPIFDKLSRIYQNLLLHRHIFKFFT